MKFSLLLLFCFAAGLLSACGGGSVDSADLKTQGIHATVRIDAYDDYTLVDCRLTAGGPNGSDVELSSGDSLTVSAYGQTREFEREPQLFGAYDSYIAEFDQNVSGSVIRISMTRADDPDAPNTYITVPAKVTISSHSGEQDNLVAADETVSLVWDQNDSGEVNIITYLSCPNSGVDAGNYTATHGVTESDTGSYSFTFLSMVDAASRDDIDDTRNCEGYARVERVGEGVLDPNFDGGNIKITQSDRVQFSIDY